MFHPLSFFLRPSASCSMPTSPAKSIHLLCVGDSISIQASRPASLLFSSPLLSSPRIAYYLPCFATLCTWAMENSPMLVLDMSSRADSKTRRTGMCCILSFRNFT